MDVVVLARGDADELRYSVETAIDLVIRGGWAIITVCLVALVVAGTVEFLVYRGRSRG
jgi:hypothetical protein